MGTTTLITAAPVPDRISGDGQPLLTTDSYGLAEAAVDRLADSDFPVRHVRIVGDDPRRRAIPGSGRPDVRPPGRQAARRAA
jgi:hypothetical protein